MEGKGETQTFKMSSSSSLVNRFFFFVSFSRTSSPLVGDARATGYRGSCEEEKGVEGRAMNEPQRRAWRSLGAVQVVPVRLNQREILQQIRARRLPLAGLAQGGC